jgi:hypothetical protein
MVIPGLIHCGERAGWQVLDILEDWLIGRGWGYQRIDGGIGLMRLSLMIKAYEF